MGSHQEEGSLSNSRSSAAAAAPIAHVDSGHLRAFPKVSIKCVGRAWLATLCSASPTTKHIDDIFTPTYCCASSHLGGGLNTAADPISDPHDLSLSTSFLRGNDSRESLTQPRR